MTPEITVILPAFNAAQFLARAIESVQEQSFADWELLIINDGSTDETLNIASAFEKQDNRIRVISQHNRGLSGARNTGLESTRGNFIQFLDADDILLPTKFQRQLDEFERNPAADIVFCKAAIIDESRDRRPATQIPDLPFEFALWERNFIVVNAPLTRRSCVKNTGHFSESKSETYPLYGCEDWAFWLRASASGARFAYIDEELVENFRHNENMSRDAIKMILSELWCLESLSESLSTEQETPIKLRELSHLYRLLRAFSHRELLRDEVALAYLRSDPLLQSSGCLTGKVQKYALPLPAFLVGRLAQIESKVAYLRLRQELAQVN